MFKKLSVIGIMAALAGGLLLAPSAQAATPTPAIQGFSKYHEVTSWTSAQMASSAWTTDFPASGCGNTQNQVKNINGAVVLSENGHPYNCTYTQTPFTVPTTPGHVYQFQTNMSKKNAWGVLWMYGSQWPQDGEIDLEEWDRDESCLTWHFQDPAINAPGALSTCYKYNNYPLIATHTANLQAGKWNTVDIVFNTTQYSVYYNGELYGTVPYPKGYPKYPNMYINIGNQDCEQYQFNLCHDTNVDALVAATFSVRDVMEFNHV
jgi:hypothetical protein